MNSKFPMFLWWGEDLIQFYNDAYRPSLGIEGKHPTALGQRAEECWPEIWSTIKPLIDQVYSGGEATWHEDQLVPIYRNGKIEDVYWTFSYSPVYEESGKVGGVLVICNESTEKVNHVKNLSESKESLDFTLEAAELGIWNYNPATNMFTANQIYSEWFGLNAEKDTDVNEAINIIAIEDRERVLHAFKNALDYSSKGLYDIEYTIRPENKPERTVRAKGKAWFDDDKVARRFLGTIQDVTERVAIRKKIEENAKTLSNVISQAPAAVAIFMGPEFIIELTNAKVLEYWGRTLDQVINKPLFEALPEAAGQGLEELLTNVLTTGVPFVANERSVNLVRNEKLEKTYVNFVYEPYRDVDGNILGVIVVANEITEQIEARKLVEESEHRLRSLIHESPNATSLLLGKDMIIEVANEAMLNVWGKDKTVLGKPVESIIPDQEKQSFLKILEDVYSSGNIYEEKDAERVLLKDGADVVNYFDFVYKPLSNAKGIVYGILVNAVDITAKKLTQKQLEDQKEYLQNAINIAELGTFKIDVATRVATYSESVRTWFSLDTLSHSLEGILEKVYDEDRDAVLQMLEDSLESESKSRHDITYRLVSERDGSTRHIRSIGKTMFKDGKPVCIIGTIQDITGQIVAREKLEESESRLRLMIEQAPVAITLTRGHDNVIEITNQPMLHLMQKQKKEEVIGKKMIDALPEIQGQQILEIAQEVIKLKIPFRGNEIPVNLLVDGEMKEHFLDVSYTPLIEDAEVTRLIHVAIDVTEQVVARKKIEEREEELKRFKFMADQARDPFILMREDRSFAYLNNKAMEAWGYSEDEIANLKVPDLDPVYHDESFKELFKKAQHENIPQFETLHKTKDQIIFPVEVNVVGLTINEEPHLFAVARDITLRKQAEDEMKIKNDQLVRVNNDLDNFIYTASHDLKAPISNIEGLMFALQRNLSDELKDSDRLQRIMDMMHGSIDRFTKTIGNLTEVVKLQKENNEKAVMVDLPEVIEEVVLDLDQVIKDSGAIIDVDLKDCDSIRFSEKNLRSVVYNLLSNSIKYRSQERVPQVFVRCQNTPDFQILSVKDNGLGIDPDRINQLFSMFKRFHSHVEGTGIGLYMIKKMIENAGGRIEVESHLGEGTTFFVYFKR